LWVREEKLRYLTPAKSATSRKREEGKRIRESDEGGGLGKSKRVRFVTKAAGGTLA